MNCFWESRLFLGEAIFHLVFPLVWVHVSVAPKDVQLVCNKLANDAGLLEARQHVRESSSVTAALWEAEGHVEVVEALGRGVWLIIARVSNNSV
jgi:hypothetical protein